MDPVDMRHIKPLLGYTTCHYIVAATVTLKVQLSSLRLVRGPDLQEP